MFDLNVMFSSGESSFGQQRTAIRWIYLDVFGLEVRQPKYVGEFREFVLIFRLMI